MKTTNARLMWAAMLLGALAAAGYAQSTPGPPASHDGAGTANGAFQQHDFEVNNAKRQVADTDILTGDRYALRSTLNYIIGMTEKFVPPQKLLELRRKRLDNLVNKNRRDLDRDTEGQPIVRDRVLLVDPTGAQLTAAAGQGFSVANDDSEAALGLRLVSLAVPRGGSAVQAAAALNAAVPGIGAETDPIFEPAGGAGLGPVAGFAVAGSPTAAVAAGPVSIVMVDGGVGTHAALAGAPIEQQAFAGKSVPTAHGTAVASLLVGQQGPFRGAARGARLFVADVYGGNPVRGSASTIVRALGWAASKKPAVVAISLVGPRSTAVERAIAALQKGGSKVVAAVGNDGPLAPNAYPASYSGVIAVTAIDGSSRPLMEAGRAAHLDFAAPGADLVAAVPGNGYMAVRGTSFAVPLVVGRLAQAGNFARLAAEAKPASGEVGLGILCGKCALSPAALGKPR